MSEHSEQNYTENNYTESCAIIMGSEEFGIRKKTLEKTFLDFKKWVKSIQTVGYNGARTVCGHNFF